MNGERSCIQMNINSEFQLAPLHDLHILAVEDDIVSAKYLEKILGKSGADFRIASDFDGMKKCCQDDFLPDVVLLDIALIGANGFDCLKWLKEKFTNRNVIYIAQTAHVLSDETLSYAEAGFDDFIGKPYKREELVNVVLANL